MPLQRGLEPVPAGVAPGVDDIAAEVYRLSGFERGEGRSEAINNPLARDGGPGKTLDARKHQLAYRVRRPQEARIAIVNHRIRYERSLHRGGQHGVERACALTANSQSSTLIPDNP